MRTLAIIANVVFLAFTGFVLMTEEVSLEGTSLLLFLLMIAVPILSVIALALRGVASKDWLSRYFERRAMEERRKLEILRLQSVQAAPAKGSVATPEGNPAIRDGPPSVS